MRYEHSEAFIVLLTEIFTGEANTHWVILFTAAVIEGS